MQTGLSDFRTRLDLRATAALQFGGGRRNPALFFGISGHTTPPRICFCINKSKIAGRGQSGCLTSAAKIVVYSLKTD